MMVLALTFRTDPELNEGGSTGEHSYLGNRGRVSRRWGGFGSGTMEVELSFFPTKVSQTRGWMSASSKQEDSVFLFQNPVGGSSEASHTGMVS